MKRKFDDIEEQFDEKKEALLEEIRHIVNEVEDLYHKGAERGEEETKALKAKLERKLNLAQRRYNDLEGRAFDQVRQHVKAADEYVNEKPYYAMGFAALAGLVVGVLLNRR